MRAMILRAPRTPLELRATFPIPRPAPARSLVRVHACGVCRTDLHVVDGELPDAKSPIIPGHEIVGSVAALASGVDALQARATASACPGSATPAASAAYCRAGTRKPVRRARNSPATRSTAATPSYAVADARYCFRAAGRIRRRRARAMAVRRAHRLSRAADGRRRADASASTASAPPRISWRKLAHHEGREMYAFTRPGDAAAQAFARELGAVWAGGSDRRRRSRSMRRSSSRRSAHWCPRRCATVVKGGIVVCAGIHMTDIPQFPYAILWGERRIVSVANLTRRDGEEFIALPRGCRHSDAASSPYPLIARQRRARGVARAAR